jgi:hypothetical protein
MIFLSLDGGRTIRYETIVEKFGHKFMKRPMNEQSSSLQDMHLRKTLILFPSFPQKSRFK